jgi:hypothetical protein
MISALLMAMQAAASAAPPACNQPVIMVVSGPTHDRARMLAYGRRLPTAGFIRSWAAIMSTLPFRRRFSKASRQKVMST